MQASAARVELAPSPRLGAKGQRTRQKILDSASALLKRRGWHELTITEIAREAGIAQPNFYTYFSSLEDVVCALAEDASALSLADVAKRRAETNDWARAMVETAIPIWQEHRELFAIMGMLADKNHPPFAALRLKQTRKVAKVFVQEIERARDAGRLPPDILPRLGGWLCVSALYAMCEKYALLRASGFSHEQMVETTAGMLRVMATGTAGQNG